MQGEKARCADEEQDNDVVRIDSGRGREMVGGGREREEGCPMGWKPESEGSFNSVECQRKNGTE